MNFYTHFAKPASSDISKARELELRMKTPFYPPITEMWQGEAYLLSRWEGCG